MIDKTVARLLEHSNEGRVTFAYGAAHGEEPNQARVLPERARGECHAARG
jgi:hypothetical protein